MKKVIETLKNIWRIEDLRQRLLITLLFVAIYRFGSFVVLPGIDPARLNQLQAQTSEGLMSLLNMFSGGAFSHASVFALGIMPYISASIVIQLLAVAVPHFQKMQKEGESGVRKLNQYTRWLTVAILLFQAPMYMINLSAQVGGEGGAFTVGQGFGFMLTSTLILSAGSMFILWLGERITDKGVGNGVSLIIMIGIIARFPSALMEEFTSALSGAEGGGLIKLLFEIIALLFVMALSIILVKATRKVPVQYAKRIEGNRQFGGARQYIPLKLFAANVMPIIFAQALMFIPLMLVRFQSDNSSSIVHSLMDNHSLLYNCIYVFLIIAFTYFYTGIVFNANEIAENLQKQGGFIEGVRPGAQTEKYLMRTVNRLILFGSIVLGIVAILPFVAEYLTYNLTGLQGLRLSIGGTGILIVVSVALETLRQVNSRALMVTYDDFDPDELLDSDKKKSKKRRLFKKK